MTEGPGKGVGNARGLQAGITTEETTAAAVTGIMTAEEAMIAIMTGKERENLGDLEPPQVTFAFPKAKF
nr:unnamed protein product [Digitaria exilis]